MVYYLRSSLEPAEGKGIKSGTPWRNNPEQSRFRRFKYQKIELYIYTFPLCNKINTLSRL